MIATGRVEEAFRAPEPGWVLRALVEQLAAEGHTKTEIIAALDQMRTRLQAAGDWRESDEDKFIDLMDAFYGWCHPSAWLLPDQPIDPEYR
jgi:hypothetical protein